MRRKLLKSGLPRSSCSNRSKGGFDNQFVLSDTLRPNATVKGSDHATLQVLTAT